MSLNRTVPRRRSRIKATRSQEAETIADVDALGSVALDLKAAGLFLDLTHYVDDGVRRQDHIAILLEAATTALRQARSTFEEARRALGERL